MSTPIAVRLVLLGVAAGTVGSYGLYAMRQSRALPAESTATAPAKITIVEALANQISNRAAKANRLAKFVPVALTSGPGATQGAIYSLASAQAYAEPDSALEPAPAPQLRGDDIASAVPQAAPTIGPKLGAKPDLKPQTKVASLAPVPPQESKAKRLPAPPPVSSALLDDTQIAGLKSRLRLTAEQAEYWPAVETALRDVARTQLRDHHLKRVHGKPSIDVNSAEVQKLIWAAMPLLGILREDQKHEVRKLARVIGLDQVASQI